MKPIGGGGKGLDILMRDQHTKRAGLVRNETGFRSQFPEQKQAACYRPLEALETWCARTFLLPHGILKFLKYEQRSEVNTHILNSFEFGDV